MIKRNLINIDSVLFSFLISILLLPIKASAADLPPVQISTRNPPTYYQTLQDAYNAANNNDVIKCKNTTFDSLNINQDTNINVFFQGGYNLDFSSVIGSTYVNGMVTISTGTATIGNFKIVPSSAVSISSPAPGFTNIKTPTLNYAACCGTVIVKVDETVVSKVSGGTLDPLPDGQHIVRVDSTDSNGSPVFAAVTFTVDTVAPVVTISSPVSSVTKTNNPVLNYTVSDGNVVVKLDGAIVSKVSGNNLGVLTDGPHTVRVESTDVANNTGFAEVTFTLDTVGTGAPAVTILSPATGFTKMKNPLLNYTVSDGTVVVKIDGVVVNKTSGALLDALADGEHTVRIEATNTFNSRAVEVAFTVDATPPIVTITSPSPQVTNNDTPTLSYTVSDGTVVVKLDGGIVSTGNGSSLGLLPDGPHTIRVESTDIAGNTGSAQVSFSIDTSSHNGGDPDASNVYCNGTEKYIVGPSAFTSGMILPVAGTNDILIDSPINGSTIDGPKTIVKGSIDTTIPVTNVIVTVSSSSTGTLSTSYSAQVNGNYFAVQVTLADGANTITTISYDKNGGQHQTAVSAYAMMPSNSITLFATPSTGIPIAQQNGQTALDVILQAEPPLSIVATSYTWDFNGSGSNQLKCHTRDTVGAEYQQTGLYLAHVIISDTSGNRYSDTVIVNVLDKVTIDNRLQELWTEMRKELLNGNNEGALDYFYEPSKDRFRQAFTAVGSGNINSIFTSVTELRFKTMYWPLVEYWALRAEPEGTFAYPVTFVQDANGLWKLKGF